MSDPEHCRINGPASTDKSLSAPSVA